MTSLRTFSWIIFILVFGLIVINWNYVIYPVFTNSGTVGNSYLLLVCAFVWAFCAKLAFSNYFKLTKFGKTSFLLLIPVTVIGSLFLTIFLANYAFYDWLREASNWQINIYFFDWGMSTIFFSIGIFFMLTALASRVLRVK